MQIPLRKDEPLIIVSTEIIGRLARYKLNLALDTGATFVMIPWEIAERLGYDPAGSPERIFITTASTIAKVPLITLEKIKVFDLEATNIKAAVHDLPPKSRVDGLLGLSFFKHFDIKLYFKQGFLEIEDP